MDGRPWFHAGPDRVFPAVLQRLEGLRKCRALQQLNDCGVAAATLSVSLVVPRACRRA